jgi:hypothetical protein
MLHPCGSTLVLFILGLLCMPPLPALAGQTVIIDQSVDHNVYGNGNVLFFGQQPADRPPDNNAVMITGRGRVEDPAGAGEVYGGRNSNGDATRNSVFSSGTVGQEGYVYGGYSVGGSAIGNSVVMDNGKVSDWSGGHGLGIVYGGYSVGGSAIGNSVSLKNDSQVGENSNSGVYGGHVVSGRGDAVGNSVNIEGYSWSLGNVYGGSSNGGDSIDNSVTVRDSTVGGMDGGNVIGGYSLSGSAAGNRVRLESSTLHEHVYGGFIDSGSGAAMYNSISMNGGAVAGDLIGGRNDGYDAGNAVGNSVSISDGAVGSAARAGSIQGGSSRSGAATYNSVSLSGTAAVIGSVFGGFTEGSGAAMHNSISMSGGAAKNLYGGRSDSGNAAGNMVDISGGTVHENVYGGYVENSGNATSNTVTLSAAPNLSASTIYGGQRNLGTGDIFTGNTLNVWHYKGSAVHGVYNFQFFHFRIPTTQSGPALAVTGTAMLGDGAGRGSTVTTVNTNGGTAPMPAGTSVTLIRAGTLDATDFTQSTTQGQHGTTLSYLWKLDATATALTATVANVQAAPSTKALSEGFLSGLALVNQGADLVAGQGMSEAASAARRAGVSGLYGLGVFGALSGGSMRYNTGSHVDMASLSLLTGLSWGKDFTPGYLTLGAFFEYGNGAYDTYNSFSNAASVHGKGNIYHLGGGILGRMDFVDAGPGHIYAEASARAGGIHNGYHSSDLRDSLGRRAKYDSDAAYYGFHLGAGYIWKITDKAALDLYGKYFWTRQGGDSVTLSTGDPLTFKDADSSRLRGGARFAYAVNEYVTPYIGAAYEHEFDGKQRASTYGYFINAPKLEGGTGIGELGFTLKSSKDLPLSFDLGVQGYVGKREGVTGSLQARLVF